MISEQVASDSSAPAYASVKATPQSGAAKRPTLTGAAGAHTRTCRLRKACLSCLTRKHARQVHMFFPGTGGGLMLRPHRAALSHLQLLASVAGPPIAGIFPWAWCA